MPTDEAVETIKKLGREYERFKRIVGEQPNYLLISEIFYGFICYVVNSVQGKPLNTPVQSYKGCTISIISKTPTPYFEFVRFDSIHQ